MYTFLQKFHSGWAYLALLALVIAVVNALIGFFFKQRIYSKRQKNCFNRFNHNSYSTTCWTHPLFCFAIR
jgi:hypothetical protein